MVSFVLGGLGPKFPKFIARPCQNRENGGSSAQIFPKPLHNEVWKKTNVSFFPQGLWGEFWGKIVWRPPFSLWFHLVGTKFPNFIWMTPPPGHQKFGDLLRGPLGPNFGRRGPPRPKVTIGKLGGFSAQIFPRALPKESWQQRKCWLESPQPPCGGGALGKDLGWKPPFSLWFPLAWVIWGPHSQNLWGGRPQATKNLVTCPGPFRTKIPKIHWEEAATQTTQTRETGGGFIPNFPQSSPQGILATKKVLAFRLKLWKNWNLQFLHFLGV